MYDAVGSSDSSHQSRLLAGECSHRCAGGLVRGRVRFPPRILDRRKFSDALDGVSC